jgi:hypothetical protein
LNATGLQVLLHAATIALVIVLVFLLALANKITGGEALGVIAAAAGLGVVGALGVTLVSKGDPPSNG